VKTRRGWWAYLLPEQAKAARKEGIALRHLCGLEYACTRRPKEALLTLDEPLNEALREKFVPHQWTLAAAESLTGGRVADYLIEVPGASEYFAGSVVTYRLASKANVLGVSREWLEKRGAVNEEVARQMAEGARKVFGADWAVAVTGVAGPGPGSHGEPVGTIWTAVDGKSGPRTRGVFLGEAPKMGRDRVRWSAVHLALVHLWEVTEAAA
jgi:PncC family amidohydrolase